jgi:hypothetical protein
MYLGSTFSYLTTGILSTETTARYFESKSSKDMYYLNIIYKPSILDTVEGVFI